MFYFYLQKEGCIIHEKLKTKSIYKRQSFVGRKLNLFFFNFQNKTRSQSKRMNISSKSIHIGEESDMFVRKIRSSFPFFSDRSVPHV